MKPHADVVPILEVNEFKQIAKRRRSQRGRQARHTHNSISERHIIAATLTEPHGLIGDRHGSADFTPALIHSLAMIAEAKSSVCERGMLAMHNFGVCTGYSISIAQTLPAP